MYLPFLQKNGLPKADYIYFTKLDEAVGKVLNFYETKHPFIFTYKGVNIKYAIARTLFYECFRLGFHKFYFQIYQQQELPKESIFRSVATMLAKNEIYDEDILYKSSINFKEAFLRPYKKVKEIVSPLQVKDIQKDILVYTHENRFVYFLNPILKHFSSYSYLHYGYLNVEEAAKETHQPCVNLEPFVQRAYPVIQKNNLLTGLFNNLIYQVDLLDVVFKYHQPKCMILVEGFSANDEVASQVAKKYGIKTVCLQQGWDFIASPSSKNLSFDKMLVWGKALVDYQQPYSPNTQFKSVGNHVLNNIQACLKENKILFLLQARKVPSAFLDEEIWDKIWQLIFFTASRFQDYTVVVRPHPVHPISQEEIEAVKKYPNIKISTPKEESLNETLWKSKICVAVNSTTILESIGTETIPIIFNLTPVPNYNPNISKEGVGIEVKNLMEAKISLIKLIEENLYRKTIIKTIKKYKKQVFQAFGKKAINNIIQEIEEYL